MSWFSYRLRRGPLGVSPYTAEQLQRLLKPGEQLRFVFEAETKHTLPRLLLDVLLKGAANVTGEVYVVITDRALLLTDREEQLFGDRLLYADLPLPSTFGPVSGRGWILLDGKPVFVPGGRKVVEKAEAALKARRVLS